MRGRSWFTRRRAKDLAEEIEVHLTMATRERIERGMAPDEARADALREFGNVPLIEQTTREGWSWTWLEQLLEDVRLGGRVLRQAPGLSATTIILIALVVGGNTTIYSMVNSLMVSPAPGVTADRLVMVRHVERGVLLTDPFVSFPNYEDYARLSHTLRPLAAWSHGERMTLDTDAGNFAVHGGLVTGNYFESLGIGVTRGRSLGDGDDRFEQPAVAVISHRLWRERFSQSADVIGRSVLLNGRPVSIVGVAAAGFVGAAREPSEDVWLPIRSYYHAIGGAATLADRGQNTVLMIGRLAPDASLSEARAETSALFSQLHAAFAESFKTYAPQGGLVPMRNPAIRVAPYSANAMLPFADMAPRFLAIFSVVTLLTLLVVSANIANLMLGRAVERQRDTALRQSLGAPRGRLLRTLLAEGATLAIVGWLAACVVAWWMSRGLLRLLEPRPDFLAEARPDWTFAAYAITLAALTTLAFSVGPGVRIRRLQVLPQLKAGEQGVVRGRSRLADALVVLQLTLSVLLVTTAGLAYRSMSLFDSGDLGFNTDNLLLVTVRAGGLDAHVVSGEAGAAERDAAFARLERIRERLAETSRVDAVTYGRRAPGAYFNATTPVWRESEMAAAQAFVRAVGPNYLRTMGLTPIAGRELTTIDRRGAGRAAVINEQLARELFPDASPLGHTPLVGAGRQAVTIVGVAANARLDGPTHERQPRYVLIAEQQLPGAAAAEPTFYIRHRGSVDAIAPAVSRSLAKVDAAAPIVSMSTMNARLDEVTIFETFLMRLMVSFAAVSLFIAALGQYAVATFTMRRRTRDFGVRLALGASAHRIQGRVIREAFALALPGLLFGFALSVTVATAFRTVLFGVTPVDPPTYAGVFLALAITSVLALYLPARRAGRVNILDTLRQE